jgi:O-acetylhomoserine (thiol)-lyase
MHIDTQCVQEGYKPRNGEPRVVPICQSTTYKYDSSDTLGDLFDLKVGGHFYSRLSNPTLEAVEHKITALEGGSGALLTSSGQAATTLAFLNLCGAGDHIVSSTTVYGGTFNLLGVTLKRLGINCTFINPDDPDDVIQQAFRPETKAYFGETIANPALNVLDIKKHARIAHRNNVPFIVDNTFPTPVLCRPFEHGADIIVHSTTKYMDGHASTIGGVIVDGGRFNWANGKFPEFTIPDESYHGLIYSEAFGPAAYITKARVQLMRDLGMTQSPQDAFIVNIGLESLHVRMERHSQNALKIAAFLENDPRISWVKYPGLASSPYYALVSQYLPRGAGGVISFGVKGGREAAKKFMDSLQLIALVVHVADARSSALHPASTTHRQMNDAQLRAAGVSADLVRLSVGIEDPGDLIYDIDRALSAM